MGMQRVERPLDLLNDLKGTEVQVLLKDNIKVQGILLAFDIHINLVIDHAILISDGILSESNSKKEKLGVLFQRGDQVVWVAPAEE